MQALQIAQQFLAAIESGDAEQLARLVPDKFTMIGPTPDRGGKNGRIAAHRARVGATPDWKLTPREPRAQVTQIPGVLLVIGTHPREWPLPSLGQDPIPATGRQIIQPAEPTEFTL